jgi:hypothetical protein
MKGRYIVKWKGMFFTGTAWNPEFPEAKQYSNKCFAQAVAEGYDGAKVIRDYGYEGQTVVYDEAEEDHDHDENCDCRRKS